MAPKLSKELRQALKGRGSQPLEVHDDETNVSYFVLSADAFTFVQPFLIDRSQREAELRRELQIGIDQFARGEVETCDVESIKREGRERLGRSSSAA